MKNPLGYGLERVEETPSTQDLAQEALRTYRKLGAILARMQTAGRGRFQRTWISSLDDSLTCSILFWDEINHPKPHLLGMATAIAAAGAIHCQLKWPNDLVIAKKKVGGILTEVMSTPQGDKITVVGVGINLNQRTFPEEIQDRAISLYQAHGQVFDPLSVLELIGTRLELLPNPESWQQLADAWAVFDDTPGTIYQPPTGHPVRAIGIGSDGQLIAENNNETVAIYAADSILGA